MHSNHIEFATVSDGFPEDHPRLLELTIFFDATTNLMGPAFDELFGNLLKKSAITCVIRDTFFTSVHQPVKRLGIPMAIFMTASATAEHCKSNLGTFISAGVLPLPAPPSGTIMDTSKLTVGLPQSDTDAAARNALLTCLPGIAPTMRVKDLPTILLTDDLNNFFIRFFLEDLNPQLPEVDCLLLNTFSELEGDAVSAMEGLCNENVFAIGPVVLQSDGSVAELKTGLMEEDPVALSWLDDQKPGSVLYISFGTVATVSMKQLLEYAAGLEISNVPFLWVIRSGVTEGLTVNSEFKEFVERTRDRALLVSWAPQAAVLNHPAVGAFLTHCGWNSTLESIACGVPMLTWPYFSDQVTNCHYITTVWQIGLELEQSPVPEEGTSIIWKEEVYEKVTRIMGDSAGIAEMRKRSGSLQMAARKAVSHGGASQGALAKFVELMITKSHQK